MNKPKLLTVAALVLAFAFLTGCASLQSKSTTDLKLRHAQLSERLGGSNVELTVNVSARRGFGGMGGDDDHEDQWEEKERIERELWKRYQAGDKEAYLPIFKAATAAEPK